MRRAAIPAPPALLRTPALPQHSRFLAGSALLLALPCATLLPGRTHLR